jgi:hypothetical protein
MSYYYKYLKYKNKYIHSKQYGGELPLLNNLNNINLFTDPDMEKHMNPIYGLILCNNGFLINNYLLNKSNLINTTLSKHIRLICKKIPGIIQPTDKLMGKNPIDYGRFIAIKYINKLNNHKLLTFNRRDLETYSIDKCTEELLRKYKNTINCDSHHILFYFTDIHDDYIYFHIILFCLLWNTNNYNGFEEYYKGIKEIFDLLGHNTKINTPTLVLKRKEKQNSFEEIIFKITNKEFKIYNQEKAQHFCKGIIPSTYSDCGEITALNLINLICYKKKIFDIAQLSHVNPIPELIEYYKVFDNFNKISDINYLPEIFCQYLNARDAWSYLIIHFANHNLNFSKECKLEQNNKYNLMPGLSLDKSCANFFQLIKNLLRINKWEDIINNNITNIQNNISNSGYGNIIIEHSSFSNIIIDCETNHYYMKQEKNIIKDLLLDSLNPEQINIINELLNKEDSITKDNYLNINFNSKLLVNLLNNNIPIELKIKLYELSLTENYSKIDLRKIIIDVDSEFFCLIQKYNFYNAINDYTYNSINFKFIEYIPKLINLNSLIKNRNITEIDLSPLFNIKSIGYNFLAGCKNLINIDLCPLSNIQIIGNFFLNNCQGLTTVDLSYLSNLKSIKDNFMCSLKKLENIVFPITSQLESIGNNFLSECAILKKIDLTNLKNLRSIGNNFMSSCKILNNIVFPISSQLELIGNNFLSNCTSLTFIDLKNLSNLRTIGSDFMSFCKKLISIEFPICSKIETIEHNFMKNCEELINIDLSKLSQLTTIGNEFMYLCLKLTNIILPIESQLKFIGKNFMMKCWRLKTIDLTSQLKLETIEESFLLDCEKISSIIISSVQSEKFNFNNSIKSKIIIK